MGRPKKTEEQKRHDAHMKVLKAQENGDAKSMFFEIYEKQTRTDHLMLYRFGEACRLFTKKTGISPPYSGLRAFKNAYYRIIKNNILS